MNENFTTQSFICHNSGSLSVYGAQCYSHMIFETVPFCPRDNNHQLLLGSAWHDSVVNGLIDFMSILFVLMIIAKLLLNINVGRSTGHNKVYL